MNKSDAKVKGNWEVLFPDLNVLVPAKATNPAGASFTPSGLKSSRFLPFLRIHLGNHSLISFIFCDLSSLFYG